MSTTGYDSDKTCVEAGGRLSYEETFEELSQLESLLPLSQQQSIESSRLTSKKVEAPKTAAAKDMNIDDANAGVRVKGSNNIKKGAKKKRQQQQIQQEDNSYKKNSFEEHDSSYIQQNNAEFRWKSIENTFISMDLKGEENQEEMFDDNFDEGGNAAVRLYPRNDWKWKFSDENDAKALDFDQIRCLWHS